MVSSVCLPQALVDRWHIGDRDLMAAIRAREFGDLNCSSLLMAYLKILNDQGAPRDFGVPSLASIAVGKVVHVLNSSDDLLSTTKEIVYSLDETTFREVLLSPRMLYPVLRTCIVVANERAQKDHAIIDLDEALLVNERYIRSRQESTNDDAYLFTLEDFCILHNILPDKDGIGVLVRPEPPSDGISLNASTWEKGIKLHTSSTGYAQELGKAISKELGGLDWSNLLITGDLVVRTLLFKQGTHGSDKTSTASKSIHLYIYGLNAEESNRKVKEIHDAWARNRTPSGFSTLVVKDSINISFLACPQSRPVLIRLKLFKSVTEALLELEPCAVGFDGSRVLMLPRYARALETGHFSLTMEYLWTCRYNHGRANIHRLHEHTDLGFGLTVLPSYIRALEEGATSATSTSIENVLLTKLSALKARCHVATATELADSSWPGLNITPQELAGNIERANNDLFSILQQAICNRLNIPVRRSGYGSYLTRRIRREVHGFDYDSMMEKQMTIPLLIPAELESQLRDLIDSRTDVGHPWLIPVHDPSKHDSQAARLPSLPEYGHASGNPRYWVISNESMWAGRYQGFDDVSEVLLCLHRWFEFAGLTRNESSTESPECLFWIIQYLRRRLGPHPFASSIDDHVRRKQGLPSLKEAQLCHAMMSPDSVLEFDTQVLEENSDQSDASDG